MVDALCQLESAVAEQQYLCVGKYELMAVLTHKGRSADSGHYVAWVKQDDKQWIQFDDEELIPRKEVRKSCGPEAAQVSGIAYAQLWSAHWPVLMCDPCGCCILMVASGTTGALCATGRAG